MKVTILGGWDVDDTTNKGWDLQLGDDRRNRLQAFCRSLGRALAAREHTVFVGSDDKAKSADYYVVQGMLKQLTEHGGREKSICPIKNIAIDHIEQREQYKDLYVEEIADNEQRRFFNAFGPGGLPAPDAKFPQAAAKIVTVEQADVVISIAGLSNTYVAGMAALVAGRRLVPIGVFGGASRHLLLAIKLLGNDKLPVEWDRLVDGSLEDDDYVEMVLRLGCLDKPRVFLGYCSKAAGIAGQLKAFLETDIGFEVIDWARDFETSEVILKAIQAAAHTCKYGVFLFTPDDSITQGTETYHVPRANVVFEAGYFMNAIGTKRTVIIVQGDTRVLADYGGYNYPTWKDAEGIASVADRLRERFSEDLVKVAGTAKRS